MTNDIPPLFEEFPPEDLAPLPSAPDAERGLVGDVLLMGNDAFEMADIKSEDFYIQRWRWFWEACEAIYAARDVIDIFSLHRTLEKAGHWEDVNSVRPLMEYIAQEYRHVYADAALVHEMARRRKILQAATEQAQRACDLNTPLPPEPEMTQSLWTQEELSSTEFPEPAGPVVGLIPNGLTILGGRPKRGKSWLMLQAGCALAVGGKFLGRDVQQMKVRYYALEDRARRLKDRTEKLGIPKEAQIEYKLRIEPLHLGGLGEIEALARSGEYGLLVIDTIRRAMPGRDFNKDGALFDDVLSKLQTIAQQTHIAIVVILHTRKATFGLDPDPVDDVLGSTGLTASADCVLALYTEQGKKGATLKGRGRDLDDIDLALQFDPQTGCWQSLGESGEAQTKEADAEILGVLEEIGKATVGAIKKATGKDFSNTRKRLITLWMTGKVKKELIEGKSYYYLPEKENEK